MRLVTFKTKKDNGRMVYLDDIDLFSNSKDLGNGYTVAEYSGNNQDIQNYSHGSIDVNFNVSITGGDGKSPPGISNNGIDFVTVTIALTLLDGKPAPLQNGKHRVTIHDSSGTEYDIISIDFLDGKVSFNYTSDMRPATISIDVNDLFISDVEAAFNIVGDNRIIIYRILP